MTTLCPSPDNELGKGVLPPVLEAQLLAQGYVFACRRTVGRVKGISLCKRPIADAFNDMEADDSQLPYARRLPTAAGPPS